MAKGGYGPDLLAYGQGPHQPTKGKRGAAGKQTTAPPIQHAKAAPAARAPSEKPPFTLGDIRRAIPPHCFRRILAKSLAYLALDLAMIALLACGTTWFDRPSVPRAAAFFLWPAYWVAQGSVMTGLWILGHECGHHAFSDHRWLDDSLGMIIHSALLVPYFSWKYSHAGHHSKCANLDGDTAFVPREESGLGLLDDTLYQHPLGRLLWILGALSVGWPLYLLSNAMGRDYGRFTSHFDPQAPLFRPNERIWVVVSDLGMLLALGCLFLIGRNVGFLRLYMVYGVPLHIVNAFLVTITYLQHTHPEIPHYADTEWDWLRGTLTTVDRDYGTILNQVLHHIADTHVVHHLFSTMPFYHAQEATQAIRPLLGHYYRWDDTPIPLALWREARECNYVAAELNENSGIMWFKHNKGRSSRET